ncbi:hypothetical protein JZ751_001369 [Albula glossodonta]|uniref:Uncharacterized protein n=1 Tax=Albula glossodonta TaxID=121402 RepID=A0A8T2PTP9_9TELE|nr:hypothetical protein JZ751_001369 [Albula glossodonta]
MQNRRAASAPTQETERDQRQRHRLSSQTNQHYFDDVAGRVTVTSCKDHQAPRALVLSSLLPSPASSAKLQYFLLPSPMYNSQLLFSLLPRPAASAQLLFFWLSSLMSSAQLLFLLLPSLTSIQCPVPSSCFSPCPAPNSDYFKGKW